MHYALRIKKFLYSQYFYGGLRIACGISLPAALMLTVFHERALGFAIAAGALGACQVDMPGPLKHKRNDMLACTLIGSLAALATGLAAYRPLTLWLTVAPLAFMVSMLDVYGAKWPRISFAALMMMVITLSQSLTFKQAWINALCLLGGGLWYTCWSAAVNRWQAERMEQQAIGESIFAVAEYLRARARLYDSKNDLDECYRNLVARQVAVVDAQDAARDLVLRNLPVLRAGRLDARRTMLFNLFVNMVDLHQMVLAAHTDYAQMREAFDDADVMVFLRDLIDKAAGDLDFLGMAVLQDRASEVRIIPKAELRALEYEIDVRRKKGFPARAPEAHAALVAVFRRAWSVLRRIDKMHRLLERPLSCTDTELRIERALQSFLLRKRVPARQIFSNLNLNSPSFRHALRVSGAVALGLWLGKSLPLTNAYWICLTIIVILKPGFSLTKQRNMQRLMGTVIGCALSVALTLGVKSTPVLLVVMFACMALGYSFLLFNYLVSVIFISAYVLILYHL
ncbi:FUSC family protein, partial [Candidatus Glomeribacter gigasporarum]|uniref:FUSC family protein n=1 Tax=Candidatus Glomeribacter gigasporarum TaxID=132144 RepID=UPI0005B25674